MEHKETPPPTEGPAAAEAEATAPAPTSPPPAEPSLVASTEPPTQAPSGAANPLRGVQLTLSEDQTGVLATYTPPASPTPTPPAADASVPAATAVPTASAVVAPPVALIKTLLQRQGWADWWQDEAALTKWLQQIPSANQPLTAVIAQRRDGRCTVGVARDRMAATLTLTRPQGGAPVTLAQVQQALADKGVKAGVMPEALAEAVALGEVTEREVARGQPAVNGEHTRFVQLVADMTERHPRVYEDGWVDYRDLGDLVVVKAGTPLLQRIPPTPGTPGFDVLGNPLTPKPGTDWPFAPGLKGVETDPNDPNLLRASVTGQPVMVSHGVKVDPNIVLPQVDLATGNVKFDGAVNIKGDVTDGMKVFSSGDVVVGGAVLAGEIEAGGNVVVKGGVIGHSEYNGHRSGARSWFSAKVMAKGSIQVRYAENAFLQSETDVVVDDYAMHSEISAFNHVTIGKPGTAKGRCIGGHTLAGVSIRVAESGSDAGPATVLQAGTHPLMVEQLAELDHDINKHTAEIANLQKIIDFVHAHPERNKDDLMGRAAITQELHQGQILELQAQLVSLKAAMQLAEGAHIAVEGKVHGGTEVRVGGKVWRTADTRPRATFQINAEGELALGG